MRNVVRLDKMGDNTLYLDCDVLQADGGTRTAAITGAFVALFLAAARGAAAGKCGQGVVAGAVAAVSVGIVAGQCMLDLDYVEDSAADVDMNIAQLSNGKFVEIQGSSERRPFDRAELDKMVRLAGTGIRKLLLLQKQAITQAS
jgi:ribonuclease PH